jgi:CCR4-NOT transcription complex subunit 6
MSEDSPDGFLRVTSYNILAQCYVKSEFFPWVNKSVLKQSSRTAAIVKKLLQLNSDLFLLQEVDSFPTLAAALTPHGYVGLFKKRSRAKKDGCAIFFNTSTLHLQTQTDVELNALASSNPDDPLLRDNVALFALFTHTPTGARFIAGTTHIFWDEALAGVKTAQIAHVFETAAALSAQWGVHKVVVGGDFNSDCEAPRLQAAAAAGFSSAFWAGDGVTNFVAVILRPLIR